MVFSFILHYIQLFMFLCPQVSFNYIRLFYIMFLHPQVLYSTFALQAVLRFSSCSIASRANRYLEQPVPIISVRCTRANSTNWPCIVFARASAGKSRLIRADSERYTVRIITETNENYRSYPAPLCRENRIGGIVNTRLFSVQRRLRAMHA